MTTLKLPNLDERTVLDVVEENFKKHDFKTYVIRMIYIGEHTLSKNDILLHFSKSVHAVNHSYCEVHIHGLLLVYDSYFVHVLEGSEDTVHRQLRFLLKREESYIEKIKKLDEEEEALETEAEGLTFMEEGAEKEKPERKMFRRLKVLMVYHSITTLWFHGWKALTARPPTLVSKLDPWATLPEHMEQLKICIDKIKRLCTMSVEDPHLNFDNMNATDHRKEALPEVALLDFLLQSKHVLELREVVHIHRRVDDYHFYFERVWPLPTHYTPRHLYKLKVDDSFVEPLPLMPWELMKKEVDDEEHEEKEDDDSDDD